MNNKQKRVLCKLACKFSREREIEKTLASQHASGQRQQAKPKGWIGGTPAAPRVIDGENMAAAGKIKDKNIHIAAMDGDEATIQVRGEGCNEMH